MDRWLLKSSRIPLTFNKSLGWTFDSGLCRLLGLYRHRHRHFVADGIPVAGELQFAVQGAERCRILAAMAYFAVDLAAGLPVQALGRQQGQHVHDLGVLFLVAVDCNGDLWRTATAIHHFWKPGLPPHFPVSRLQIPEYPPRNGDERQLAHHDVARRLLARRTIWRRPLKL